MHTLPRGIVYVLALMAVVATSSCTAPATQLDLLRERGTLRVATRNGPTTYFIDRDGETGFDYEMARRFARYLGVDLEIVRAGSGSQVTALVRSGRADLGAAALSHAFIESRGLAAGPDYHWITQQLVYRLGRRVPRSLDDVFPDQVHVLDSTVPERQLAELSARHPRLSFYMHDDKDTDELLDMIEQGRIAYAILPSDELAHARQVRPAIRAAIAVTEPEPLAWALPATRDDSVLREARRFMYTIRNDGTLAALLEEFYGHVESFDYVDSRAFLERMEKRLPVYRNLFQEAAAENGMDWRLLAAISYQESHWDARARSPTGVRGMMMLTRVTADRLGVSNRMDVRESITGGARYFAELHARLPERIPEPDRTWMTLAAYNVGLGHLEDARVLTERSGADPDLWQDVREHLPLLGVRKWYTQTRYGYARGHEPVQYVRNIRRYFHVLVQLNQPHLPVEQRVFADQLLDLPIL